MVIRALALAGWLLLSGCGTNEPEGSRRYEAKPASDQNQAETSTNTSRHDAPETTPGSSPKADPKASAEEPETEGELPETEEDAEQKSAKTPVIPKAPHGVDWQLTSPDGLWSARITKVNTTNLLVTVRKGNEEIWSEVEVPYKPSLSEKDYAEYHLSQSTWSRAEQSLTFWIKLTNSECELTWEVDGWTSDETAIMQGHCHL